MHHGITPENTFQQHQQRKIFLLLYIHHGRLGSVERKLTLPLYIIQDEFSQTCSPQFPVQSLRVINPDKQQKCKLQQEG
jgi:hypothetical protein